MPKPLSHTDAMRFNRQIVLPQIDLEGQERLAESRILVIGVGGLGSAAANSLCASGVGNLTLVDNDTVEATNLPRQTLFDETQIGEGKVIAAKQRLEAINQACAITALSTSIHAQDINALIAQHDVVLDCTDNTDSRDAINKACVEQGVALVSGAAIRFEGQLFVYKPRASACYACLRTLFDAPELSCTEAGIFSPVVNIIGIYQAMLAMQLIMEVGEVPLNALLTFDGLGHQWQRWSLPKQPNCPVCGEQNP